MATLSLSSVSLNSSNWSSPQLNHLSTGKSVHFPQRKTISVPIECSSRPQKKATAHHMKTRPKKKGYDRRRKGPTRYPPLTERPAVWDYLTAKPSALRGLGLETQIVQPAAQAAPVDVEAAPAS